MMFGLPPPFNLAEARVCHDCGGEGWVASPAVTAARPNGEDDLRGSSLTLDNTVAIAGRAIRCNRCLNGFVFRIIPGDQLRQYLIQFLEHLLKDPNFKMELSRASYEGTELRLASGE